MHSRNTSRVNARKQELKENGRRGARYIMFSVGEVRLETRRKLLTFRRALDAFTKGEIA